MKTKKRNMILLIILAVVIYAIPFGLIGFGVYLDSTSKSFERKGDQIEVSKGKMILDRESSYYDEEEGVFYIIGYLKNTTQKDYDSVGVSYRVYDEEGNVLGEATAYLDTLKKGKTWKFKVSYMDIDAKTVSDFEFTGIEYY